MKRVKTDYTHKKRCDVTLLIGLKSGRTMTFYCPYYVANGIRKKIINKRREILTGKYPENSLSIISGEPGQFERVFIEVSQIETIEIND